MMSGHRYWHALAITGFVVAVLCLQVGGAFGIRTDLFLQWSVPVTGTNTRVVELQGGKAAPHLGGVPLLPVQALIPIERRHLAIVLG